MPINLQHPDVLLLTVGAVFLLAGWLLYWISINVAGGLIGGGAGLIVAEVITSLQNDLSPTQESLLRVALVVIGLVVGILLMRWMHRLAFFLAGSLIGGAGYYLVVTALREQGVEWAQGDAVIAFGSAVAGIVIGGVCVFAARYIIALCTAAIGAVLIMEATGWPWNGLPAVPLGVIGFALQVGVAKPWRRREKSAAGEDASS